MLGLGAPTTPQPVPWNTGMTPAPQGTPPPPGSVNIGGVLTVQSAAVLQKQEKQAADARLEAQQSQPLITGLAGHIRSFWQIAQDSKRTTEEAMLKAVRARRGEYSPEKLQHIRAQGGSEIYMMLFSMKARQAGSLIRDILLGMRSDKPWEVMPTPVPQLPPQMVDEIVNSVGMEVYQAQMAGLLVTMDQVRQRMRDMRDQIDAQVQEEARHKAQLMEDKMEDQLLEGGFHEALNQFIEDLVTFKTAFIKGPVIRKRKKLEWDPTGALIVSEVLKLEWERVDPFMMYPAPWAENCDDAPLIERHRLSRNDLAVLKGVEGYSTEAIDKVLELHGQHGLRHWLSVDSAKADAEGRDQITLTVNNELIDALQYWGSVSGQMLRDWGLDETEVPDVSKEYQVEAWLIGDHVIKAVLNQDALGRRPYYMDSYEPVPGAYWGNSLYDLMCDTEDMCNAAARAIANNMGIASGPQVWVNVERMPPGEDITQMYPWKIWQGTSDPVGGAAKPIEFFQPNSNVQELVATYERFSILADEYTGIPRYMTGTEGTPGAGRTASGLSMMIGNASKVIKQVICHIDVNVLKPLLERLYYYNMLYGEDPDLKGDACILARGALSIAVREQAQVRRNEFLLTTNNPVDLMITGLEGRAEVLREQAKSLDMNTDRIVPPVSVIRQRQQMQMMMQAQAAQQGQGGEEGDDEGGGNAPPKKSGKGPPARGGASQPNQPLMNGAPATDNFSPAKQGPRQ